jgi:RNA polymerase sigma factor (sigma-70 family)
VLQTIILRLMGRELSDELLAKPKGYWWQAAVNEALSIVESRKRWTTEPIFVKDEDRNQRESDDVARKTAALHHEADAQRRLMDAIARLEPDDVGLLLLYREGYDDREIAEIRGEREGTVSSKLSRARKKLKQLMMEDAS